MKLDEQRHLAALRGSIARRVQILQEGSLHHGAAFMILQKNRNLLLLLLVAVGAAFILVPMIVPVAPHMLEGLRVGGWD